LYADGARAAIVNTTVSGLFAGVLKRAGFRVICLVHELPQLIADNGLASHARSIAQYADHVVFAAPQVRDGFATVAPVPADKVVLRSQGLFTRSRYLGRSDNAQARAVLRARLGIAHDARVVLAVGYGDHRKGLDIFGEMAAELAERHPDLHFVWVGHYDEALMNSARTRLYGCGAFDRLHAIGLDFDTDDYYAGADVYALTSREDPFPRRDGSARGRPAGGDVRRHRRPSRSSRAAAACWCPNCARRRSPPRSRPARRSRGACGHGREGRHLVEAEYNFPPLRVRPAAPRRHRSAARVGGGANYNYAPLMRARLESIAAQSLPAYEIIVLDDARPTTASRSWRACAAACRSISPWCRGAPIPARSSASGKKAWSWPRGDYVWIAEADDLSAPEFLATALRPMLERHARGDELLPVAADRRERRRARRELPLLDRRHLADRWTQAYVCDGAEEIRRGLSVKNTIPNVSAVVFRREPLRKVLDERMDRSPACAWPATGSPTCAARRMARGLQPAVAQHAPAPHAQRHPAAADQLPHLLEVLTVQKAVRDSTRRRRRCRNRRRAMRRRCTSSSACRPNRRRGSNRTRGRPAARARRMSTASTCLVVGGNGFIGSHLVDALRAAGRAVRVYDAGAPRGDTDWTGVDYRQGAFADEAALGAALDGVDAVFHLVSTTVPSTSNADPRADVQGNLLGSLGLMQAMMARDVRRIVFFSSGGTVYGNPRVLPVPEDHPLEPISSYGVVKVAIERYLLMYGRLGVLDPLILRPGNPYGPRQGAAGIQGVIPAFLRRVRDGEALRCGATAAWCAITSTSPTWSSWQ
jgi:dTDP-4-dehydrorhamnose reductase